MRPMSSKRDGTEGEVPHGGQVSPPCLALFPASFPAFLCAFLTTAILLPCPAAGLAPSCLRTRSTGPLLDKLRIRMTGKAGKPAQEGERKGGKTFRPPGAGSSQIWRRPRGQANISCLGVRQAQLSPTIPELLWLTAQAQRPRRPGQDRRRLLFRLTDLGPRGRCLLDACGRRLCRAGRNVPDRPFTRRAGQCRDLICPPTDGLQKSVNGTASADVQHVRQWSSQALARQPYAPLRKLSYLPAVLSAAVRSAIITD